MKKDECTESHGRFDPCKKCDEEFNVKMVLLRPDIYELVKRINERREKIGAPKIFEDIKMDS